MKTQQIILLLILVVLLIGCNDQNDSVKKSLLVSEKELSNLKYTTVHERHIVLLSLEHPDSNESDDLSTTGSDCFIFKPTTSLEDVQIAIEQNSSIDSFSIKEVKSGDLVAFSSQQKDTFSFKKGVEYEYCLYHKGGEYPTQQLFVHFDTHENNETLQRYSSADINTLKNGTSCIDCDLSGYDFSTNHSNLQGLNLSEANLKGANFESCKLDNATLDKANVSNAIFIDARMIATSMKHIETLDKESFYPQSIDKADFSYSDLSELNMSKVLLPQDTHTTTKFIHTNLKNAFFLDANLTGMDFSYADLDGADFSGARLLNVTFEHINTLDFSTFKPENIDTSSFAYSDLRKISLYTPKYQHITISNVNFTESNLSKAELNDRSFNTCNFSHADMSNADISNSTFKNSTLMGVSFNKTTFEGANFSTSDLESVSIKNSSLDKVTFKDTNLKSVDFSNMDLSGFDFSGAIFDNAILKGVNFTNATLDNASFKYADMNNSILTGASVTNAVFEHVNFQYAVLDGIDFSSDNLQYSDFSYANLDKSNLSHANAKHAIFYKSSDEGSTKSGMLLADSVSKDGDICASNSTTRCGLQFSTDYQKESYEIGSHCVVVEYPHRSEPTELCSWKNFDLSSCQEPFCSYCNGRRIELKDTYRTFSDASICVPYGSEISLTYHAATNGEALDKFLPKDHTTKCTKLIKAEDVGMDFPDQHYICYDYISKSNSQQIIQPPPSIE